MHHLVAVKKKSKMCLTEVWSVSVRFVTVTQSFLILGMFRSFLFCYPCIIVPYFVFVVSQHLLLCWLV